MPHDKKNILLFNPSFNASNMYLPYFWATAKTYYEHNGKKSNEYNWVNPLFNYLNTLDEIKSFIRANPPDIFGISLYVWNHTMALKTAAWVREEFPDCVIISGGPHQYFKHDPNWFETMYFLDASLAGDDYGELSVCDILDNLDDLKWNAVHGVVYPSKNRKLILNSKKTQNKKDFLWDYSVYAEQFDALDFYKKSMESYNPTYTAQGLLETTRGCPYACTFCDWGGGTASKVIIKAMRFVKQDIEFLGHLRVEGVFFCDANLGILKDRDVAVMQHIADTKKQFNKFYSLHYGGYAKTAVALPYIKKILEIEAENYLMRALTYKLSLQTLDPVTLKNIDRTDVKFEHYLELSQHLQKNYSYDAYAEIIAGLPGITPDKFYHEINVFGQHDIIMNYYDWYLLPETPSFAQSYRHQYKIKTVKKIFGNQNLDSYSENFEKESEIVVSTYSYSYDDYKEMHISYAWYRTFWTAGVIYDTITRIIKKYHICLGDFTKKFYREFFTDPKVSGLFLKNLNNNINQTFDRFLNEDKFMLLVDTEYVESADLVKLMAMTVFTNLDKFENELTEWIHATWPLITTKSIQDDLSNTITKKNFKTKKGYLLKKHFTHEIFADLKDHSGVSSVLDTYSSSSIPVPIKGFLKAQTVLF
jgi:putative methyltransferase